MAKKTKTTEKATAATLAARQREISIAEFFTKNRHLLGFDSPRRGLLTTVKEGEYSIAPRPACEKQEIESCPTLTLR